MATRRLLFIIIDGLSASRLQQAIDKQLVPNIAAFCSNRVKKYRITCPPATAAFQSELLYGSQDVVHGFTWFDREKRLIRRMDVPEDVMHTERLLQGTHTNPPLLSIDGTVSYCIVFAGGVSRQFISCADGEFLPSSRWRLGHVMAALFRGALLFPIKLPDLLADTIQTIRCFGEPHTGLHWLAMRSFCSVLDGLVTSSAAADMREGAHIVVANCPLYDAVAHRRGPDHSEAIRKLSHIDKRFSQFHATALENGYEVFLCSDHGFAAALPFHHVEGKLFAVSVFEACAPGPVDDRFRELAKKKHELSVRGSALRKWHSLFGFWMGKWIRQEHQDILQRLKEEYAFPGDEIAVVTSGSVAHVYVGQHPDGMSVEEIEMRFPRLVPTLAASRAVGLIVARSKRHGPVVLFQGKRVLLDDADALATLVPFQKLGVAFLEGLLRKTISVKTAGDLVVYGSYAKAGNITFDSEFGTHGGIHPDEFDAFFVSSPGLSLQEGELDPAKLNAILRERYS